MKLVTILAAIAGLVLGTVIVAYYGFGAVAAALGTIGWGGFLIVAAFHLAVMGLLGIAWWVIVPPPHVGPTPYLWGRLIRDSGAEVLPLSQIGGFVMGARAATLLGPTMTV